MRGVRLAKKTVDTILEAPAPVHLVFPNEGNLHSLTAISPTAFFDILSPPYTDEMIDSSNESM